MQIYFSVVFTVPVFIALIIFIITKKWENVAITGFFVIALSLSAYMGFLVRKWVVIAYLDETTLYIEQIKKKYRIPLHEIVEARYWSWTLGISREPIIVVYYLNGDQKREKILIIPTSLDKDGKFYFDKNRLSMNLRILDLLIDKIKEQKLERETGANTS